MEFFLGFFPDANASHKIKKVIGEAGRVFDGLQIPVRWSNPNTYHLSILPLGSELSFIQIFLLKYRLKNFSTKPFKVVFKNIRLGISRKYKELIYLDLKEGGEGMREILFELRKVLKIKDNGNFVPHLVLGRVSKDLCDQEYANLVKDLDTVSKDLDIDCIEFYVNSISFAKSSQSEISILLELNHSH